MSDYEEGEICPACVKGTLQLKEVEGCSCHINPPCSACVDNTVECPDCGWEEDE